ncbi:hypothetical protein G6F22_017489 [Rhizopus arrhizus]|nr:hypothetical protein G6F22_017489 [Rhizopus arrhizus]
MLHRLPGGTCSVPVGIAPDRLHQRCALEGFEVAVFVEDRFLPARVHTHSGPVGLLHLQRGGEQGSLRTAGGNLVTLHRRHHRLRAQQADAGDLRSVAVHRQPQSLDVERRAGGKPALLPGRGLRIHRQRMPAAFCILGLQRCGAMHVGPVHRQPGARLRARQRDVESPRTAWHRVRARAH